MGIALDNETREREFYLQNAARTSNPVGREMFLQIADDELEHYERLKELHAKWVHQEKWPESVPLEVKGTRVKDVLNEVIARMEKIPVGDKGDLDAIRTAIDFEARGAALYGRLRDAVSDPKQKAFFHLLQGSKMSITCRFGQTEELLTDPASWYRSKEHHGLDGG